MLLTSHLNLASALVMLFVEQRNLNGLQKPLLKKINYILHKEEHVRRGSKEIKFSRSGNRQRCRICLNGCKTKAKKDCLKNSNSGVKFVAKVLAVHLQYVYVIIVTKHRLDLIIIVSFIVTFVTYF